MSVAELAIVVGCGAWLAGLAIAAACAVRRWWRRPPALELPAALVARHRWFDDEDPS